MISQENFNTILFGIRGQGGPAARQTEHGVFCLYRTEAGRKCAAGWLIPDGDPEASTEQTGTVESLTFFKDKLSYEDIRSLRQLQMIHDAASRWDHILCSDKEFFLNWEPRMKKFAEANGLTYTPA